jgi:2-dehydro-3-deoxy-D-arabinonate dehydratase
MYLTRHTTTHGPRWAVDGRYLPFGLRLGALLTMPRQQMLDLLASLREVGEEANQRFRAACESELEVWGSGVTYLRSRDARKAESATADVYQNVYEAERPEIFFKSPGWRVVGNGEEIRIRADSKWNVPEPELTLLINAGGEIIGYTAGNDMSSRAIEGLNPLYLPQAKTYDGSCAIGPGIRVATADEMSDLPIHLQIERAGAIEFDGDTSTSQMKRSFEELVTYLYRELQFPFGALLMTGTGIVPPDHFSLKSGDIVRVTVGEDTLENPVA